MCSREQARNKMSPLHSQASTEPFPFIFSLDSHLT